MNETYIEIEMTIGQKAWGFFLFGAALFVLVMAILDENGLERVSAINVILLAVSLILFGTVVMMANYLVMMLPEWFTLRTSSEPIPSAFNILFGAVFMILAAIFLIQGLNSESVSWRYVLGIIFTFLGLSSMFIKESDETIAKRIAKYERLEGAQLIKETLSYHKGDAALTGAAKAGVGCGVLFLGGGVTLGGLGFAFIMLLWIARDAAWLFMVPIAIVVLVIVGYVMAQQFADRDVMKAFRGDSRYWLQYVQSSGLRFPTEADYKYDSETRRLAEVIEEVWENNPERVDELLAASGEIAILQSPVTQKIEAFGKVITVTSGTLGRGISKTNLKAKLFHEIVRSSYGDGTVRFAYKTIREMYFSGADIPNIQGWINFYQKQCFRADDELVSLGLYEELVRMLHDESGREGAQSLHERLEPYAAERMDRLIQTYGT